MTILVIAATHLESARLMDDLPGARVVVAGIGAVNTAHALTRELVQHGAPAVVIQTGIAGAYVPGGLVVGNVALATEEVYGDVGVLTPDGWLSAEEIGIPLAGASETRPARFNHFPLDEALIARATAAGSGLVARSGRFLTLAQVTGVRAVGDALYDRFGALCESMEGAAAAHVCALHDVPFLEVRGVSNLVEDRDRSRWRIKEASEAAQHVVRRLVEQRERWLV